MHVHIDVVAYYFCVKNHIGLLLWRWIWHLYGLLHSQIMRGHQRNDDKLEDLCDGTAYKEHPLFSKDETALQIMLYYDDLEVANPIGSRSTKHKLGKQELCIHCMCLYACSTCRCFLFSTGQYFTSVSLVIEHYSATDSSEAKLHKTVWN